SPDSSERRRRGARPPRCQRRLKESAQRKIIQQQKRCTTRRRWSSYETICDQEGSLRITAYPHSHRHHVDNFPGNITIIPQQQEYRNGKRRSTLRCALKRTYTRLHTPPYSQSI